jgi:hypothetical protein
MANTGREPLMNLALFGYRQFVMGSIVAFIYGTSMSGSTYLLQVYMQLGLACQSRMSAAFYCQLGLYLQ